MAEIFYSFFTFLLTSRTYMKSFDVIPEIGSIDLGIGMGSWRIIEFGFCKNRKRLKRDIFKGIEERGNDTQLWFIHLHLPILFTIQDLFFFYLINILFLKSKNSWNCTGSAKLKDKQIFCTLVPSRRHVDIFHKIDTAAYHIIAFVVHFFHSFFP